MVSLALVAGNAAVFAALGRHDFVSFDDPQYITHNPHVAAGLSWHAVVWAFTSGYAANWHPVTWLSHLADVQLFGLAAGPQHLMSLLIHIVDTILLFRILDVMTGASWRSAVVAALFAVHPLHVESVAWIAERKDVLSALFWLLTIGAYVRYVREPRLGRYLMVMLSLAVGLMAKPMLVTLPAVLLILDFWPLRRFESPKSAKSPESPKGPEGPEGPESSKGPAGPKGAMALILEKLPLLALAMASSVVTILAQRQSGAMAPFDQFTPATRAAHALVSYATYLVQMVWPARLAVFYPLPVSEPTVTVLLSALLVGGVSVLAIATARRHPYVLGGWVWYLVALLPVSGVMQVGGQGMADRFTYIPLIGVFVMIAWGLPDLVARRPSLAPALNGATVLVLVACALVAYRQVGYWQNSETLWRHALDVTTNNYRAHNALGSVLSQQGRADDAIGHFREAVRLEPAYAEARTNLGAELAKQGHVDEAIAEYADALRVSPGLGLAHNNLGLAYASQGRPEDALRECLEAVRLTPDNADFRYNAAVLLDAHGDRQEAITQLQAALALQPDHQAAERALAALLKR
jgi:Tfp pilus assembly protein PilF